MGTTFRFISSIEESGIVLEWFRSQENSLVELPVEGNTSFRISGMQESNGNNGSAQAINIFEPKTRRGVLTTAGEVHFVASPISKYPELNKISRRFKKWISQYTLVHSFNRECDHSFDYFLEGSLRNWDSELFALPQGLQMLKKGCYFVSEDDNESRTNKLCKELELRDVKGIT